MITQYIKLLRTNQWLKNIFILAPVLFSFKIPDFSQIVNLLYATIGFCFISSAIYIINDWKDIESDRLHPKKKNRPLASGKIKLRAAFVLCVACIVISFSTYLFLIKNTGALLLLGTYFILNIGYCFKLKHIAIVDIMIVASGFVIRLLIGGITGNIIVSQWIILITFLLALLLVVGKRRHDVSIFEETGYSLRKSINGYNTSFLNAIIIIIISAIIIFYIMYSTSPEVIARNGKYLYLTSIFVIIGLFRYLQVLFVENKGDSPTELIMNDRFLQIDIIMWIISFVFISINANI